VKTWSYQFESQKVRISLSSSQNEVTKLSTSVFVTLPFIIASTLQLYRALAISSAGLIRLFVTCKLLLLLHSIQYTLNTAVNEPYPNACTLETTTQELEMMQIKTRYENFFFQPDD